MDPEFEIRAVDMNDSNLDLSKHDIQIEFS
jgi:hypothetical protein